MITVGSTADCSSNIINTSIKAQHTIFCGFLRFGGWFGVAVSALVI